MSTSMSENLMPSSEVQNQGLQSLGDSNLNTEMEVYANLTNRIGYTIYPAIFIIIFTIILIVNISDISSVGIIIFSFIYLILLTIIFLILYFNTLKFTFTKDLFSNFLHIRKKNFFCCSLERADFQLNYIIVDIIGNKSEQSISIVKIHKDFDINTFSIAKKPPKTYHTPSDTKNSDELKNKLCEFIGSPPED